MPADNAERFSAEIEPASGGGHWVRVPFDAKQRFGAARPPVVARVGGVEYRSRLARYGGQTVLGIRKATLAEAGVGVGDSVEVELALDEQPRTVVLPPELESALAGSRPARAAYDALSFSHRREYAEWVASAKRPETRERRAAQAVERLTEAG
jgi:hypothetical protein